MVILIPVKRKGSAAIGFQISKKLYGSLYIPCSVRRRHEIAVLFHAHGGVCIRDFGQLKDGAFGGNVTFGAYTAYDSNIKLQNDLDRNIAG